MSDSNSEGIFSDIFEVIDDSLKADYLAKRIAYHNNKQSRPLTNEEYEQHLKYVEERERKARERKKKNDALDWNVDETDLALFLFVCIVGIIFFFVLIG